VRAGLHQRNEWESDVKNKALDFKVLESLVDKNLFRQINKEVTPIFETNFSRTICLILFDGAEIELSMDSGEIRAGESTRPISELELELKSGEPLQLFKLALALLDQIPLEVEHTSKAEYGYQLYTSTKPSVKKIRFPDLSECTNIAPALQCMIGSCLLHLQSNISGAIQKLDEEYLHQVRVSLRLLRVILSMLEIFSPEDELSNLHVQVAELCIEFGQLREWDVFVTQTLKSALPDMSDRGAISLLHVSEEMRRQHHAAVEIKLNSQNYQRFLLSFGAWMHGNYWHELNLINFSLKKFAKLFLEKRNRKLIRRGKNLIRSNPSQLHKLRITCKKLRYSVEIFSSLFSQAKAKQYLSTLTRLQDTLGSLNDIAVAHRLLDELGKQVPEESTLLIRDWITQDYAEKIKVLNKNWKRFSEQKAFWSD
jgi:inorganic triphosphatase YgiF